jgi:DNA polymerase sigma
VDSRFAYRRAAVERLKNVLDLVFPNADALVFHGYFHFFNAAIAFHRGS